MCRQFLILKMRVAIKKNVENHCSNTTFLPSYLFYYQQKNQRKKLKTSNNEFKAHLDVWPLLNNY